MFDPSEEEIPSASYPTIHWFPGHIAKAQRELKERLPIIDFVLELVDARIPESSRFGQTTEIIKSKPSIVVLTKIDLADPERTRAWVRRLRDSGMQVVSLNAQTGAGISELKVEIAKLNAKVQAKMKTRGRLPRPARIMVVGLPNVGKSSLINRLTRTGRARTGDKPGVTRVPSWIRIGKDLELMDMPGIIPPKLGEPLVALKLAMTGSVSTEAYDPLEVARCALDILKEHAPAILKSLEPISNLEDFARSRGFLKQGEQLDLERASRTFLWDLCTGSLGVMTLDAP